MDCNNCTRESCFCCPIAYRMHCERNARRAEYRRKTRIRRAVAGALVRLDQRIEKALATPTVGGRDVARTAQATNKGRLVRL